MSAVDGTLTVNDICYAALSKSGLIGLGQSPNGQEILDAQNDLSDMLAQWNTKTWLVWEKIDLSVISTGQTTPYTIGPTTTALGAAQISIATGYPRPDRVEAAYIRILANSGVPVDYPLEYIPSAESYSRTALKTLITFSKAYYYDPSSPQGKIYFYPWPQASIYEMHVIVKNAFPLQLPLNTDLSTLPTVARAAMKFSLARRLRQAYGKGLRPDPELNALAKDALETMRMSQIQAPLLTMPVTLRRRDAYNIYGDLFY